VCAVSRARALRPHNTPSQLVAARENDTELASVLFTGNSEIKELDDVRGRKLGIGMFDSLGSSFLPLHHLHKHSQSRSAFSAIPSFLCALSSSPLLLE
jgi:ABC-type phosphate/phosphonate transport system substrate-binding protein